MHTLIVAALKRLNTREFVLLDELARSVGCASANLAEALRQAADEGAPLEHEPARGYRLLEPLDWLDATRIRAAVAATGLEVRVVAVCGSTNTEMMREARRGGPGRQVLAAEVQRQGRGRLGRPWHSGLCNALTFSLLWRTEKPVSALSGLSLAVGVAIVRALRQHGVSARLKWPNDIVWQERKLGGVLIEVHGAAHESCAAVIGVGLNARLGAGARRQIDQAVADLTEAGGARSRSDWLVAILIELAAILDVFSREGFAPLQREWDGYHAHAGRPVELTLPNGERVRGIATGVDEAGRLLLATGKGTRAVLSGDVSLRASA